MNFHGEGDGTPLQYSCLENPMDRGAWWAADHGIAKRRTQLSDITFTFHFPALEKEMATHSSVLAWRIPGMGEPGGLPSVGSHRVEHDWSDLAATAATELFQSLSFNKYWFLTVWQPRFYILEILCKRPSPHGAYVLIDTNTDLSNVNLSPPGNDTYSVWQQSLGIF